MSAGQIMPTFLVIIQRPAVEADLGRIQGVFARFATADEAAAAVVQRHAGAAVLGTSELPSEAGVGRESSGLGPVAMARTTFFCCDTYVSAPRGKLAIGEHKELKTADEVVRRAERLAEKAPNVEAMAYRIKADHEFEDFSEPKVLARSGRTPKK